MLRYLGRVENVVKFQHLCGLQWDETISSLPCELPTSKNGFYHEYNRTSSNEDNNKDFEKGNYYQTQDSESDEVPKMMRNTNKINNMVYSCNRVVHELFKFGSELGNELFYITFLPFIFWNVDDYIGRRLIILWVFNMYAGQGLKDVLCWPRPSSPPVLRLEEIYESEYGMPSTHAIAGSIIPFGLVYFTYDRFQVSSSLYFPFQFFLL